MARRGLALLAFAAAVGAAFKWLGDRGQAPGDVPGEDATSRAVATDGPDANAGRSGNGAPTRDELYQRARELGVRGRSKMNKAQLARAVGAAT